MRLDPRLELGAQHFEGFLFMQIVCKLERRRLAASDELLCQEKNRLINFVQNLTTFDENNESDYRDIWWPICLLQSHLSARATGGALYRNK
jgi:hypothetical protein